MITEGLPLNRRLAPLSFHCSYGRDGEGFSKNIGCVACRFTGDHSGINKELPSGSVTGFGCKYTG